MKATDIKKHIVQRLDLLRQEKVDPLIHSITITSLADSGYCSVMNDADTAAQKYHSAVLDGRLCAPVCGLTSCKDSGILDPDNACTKTGHRI